MSRVIDKAIFGRSWINIVAQDDEVLMRVEERSGLSIKGGFGWFTHCAIITDKNQYVIDASRETVERYFLAVDPGGCAGAQV